MKSQRKANYFITKLLRFFSIRIALFLAKYRITPNQVTLISFGIGILTALSFSVGRWAFNILGMFFFLFAFLLDFIDGDLARLRNQASQFGEWLDAVTGKIESVLLFLGICIGQSRHHSPVLVWFLGFVAISGYYVSQSLMYKNLILNYKRKLNAPNETLRRINIQMNTGKRGSTFRKITRELFSGGIFITYAIIFAAIFNQMVLFLWFAAIYMWLDHALQVYFKGKEFKNFERYAYGKNI